MTAENYRERRKCARAERLRARAARAGVALEAGEAFEVSRQCSEAKRDALASRLSPAVRLSIRRGIAKAGVTPMLGAIGGALQSQFSLASNSARHEIAREGGGKSTMSHERREPATHEMEGAIQRGRFEVYREGGLFERAVRALETLASLATFLTARARAEAARDVVIAKPVEAAPVDGAKPVEAAPVDGAK